MVNQIKYLAFEADISLLELARKADTDKNTVYSLARSGDELPDSVQLGTLRKIATAVGKKAIVTFVDIEEAPPESEARQ